MPKRKFGGLKVYRIYIKENEPYARLIGAIADGYVRYHAFKRSDGKFIETSLCHHNTFVSWADREATLDERRLFDTDAAAKAESEIAITKQRNNLDDISDEELLAEVRKRKLRLDN